MAERERGRERMDGGSTRNKIARVRREGFRRIITINNATEEDGVWIDEVWEGWHG